MNIVILGQLTVSPTVNLENHIDPEENICKTSFHSHSWIANLAQGISKIGKEHKVTVICFTGLISENKEYFYQGVRYIYLKSESKIYNFLTFYSKEYKKVRSLLNQIKPDIIHAQGRQIEALYALYSKYLTVLTSHGEIRNELLSYKVNLRFLRSLLLEYLVNKKMKWAIGVSPSCVADLKRFLPQDKVFLIDNAIDFAFFKNNDLIYNKYFLFVGSLTERKGAFKVVQLLEQFPSFSVKMAFQSKEVGYLAKIKRYVKEKGFEDRVEFLGNVSSIELTEQMRKCYCVCLPSDFESFGMSLAECQAVGKPVVASNVGGIPYVISDKKTGLLFNLDKTDDFTKNVSFLVNNPKSAMKMGKYAKKIAFERWHPISVAKETIEVYHKIINHFNIKVT